MQHSTARLILKVQFFNEQHSIAQTIENEQCRLYVIEQLTLDLRQHMARDAIGEIESVQQFTAEYHMEEWKIENDPTYEP